MRLDINGIVLRTALFVPGCFASWYLLCQRLPNEPMAGQGQALTVREARWGQGMIFCVYNAQEECTGALIADFCSIKLRIAALKDLFIVFGSQEGNLVYVGPESNEHDMSIAQADGGGCSATKILDDNKDKRMYKAETQVKLSSSVADVAEPGHAVIYERNKQNIQLVRDGLNAKNQANYSCAFQKYCRTRDLAIYAATMEVYLVSWLAVWIIMLLAPVKVGVISFMAFMALVFISHFSFKYDN